MKLITLVLTLVLALLSTAATGSAALPQDDEDRQPTQTEKTITERWMSMQSDYRPVIRRTNLFDLNDIPVVLLRTDTETQLRIELPSFGDFVISSTLPNPYIGSPAYDILDTWRNSLNVDVVTGKYYWEW